MAEVDWLSKREVLASRALQFMQMHLERELAWQIAADFGPGSAPTSGRGGSEMRGGDYLTCG